VLGSDDPRADAEVIALAVNAYKTMGIKSIRLVLNYLVDKESRTKHRNALVDHFTHDIGDLCTDFHNRLANNLSRILHGKTDQDHPNTKNAPSILDYNNDYSQDYFTKVKKYLDAMNISYVIDPTLVRGLDYYNHTAFEIMSDHEGFGAITT